MYKLIIEDDEGKTTVVPLIRDEITIGRKEGNTIRLTERNVSRKHAKLVKSNGSVLIEDLQSHNGIKINGDRIQGRSAVSEGDRIQIGDYQLALKLDKSQAAPQGVREDEKTIPFDKDSGKASDAQTALNPIVSADGAEQPARLVVVSSNFAGQEFMLDKAAVVIGRTDENDVVINHRSISRHHAKIVREGGHYHVVDLQSANGVRVNGEEYGKVELRRGDHIDLGHVRMRFIAPGEDFLFERDAKVVDVAGDKKGKGMLIAIIAVAVVVLGGGGFAIIKMLSGKSSGEGGQQGGDTEIQVLRINSEIDKLMKQFDWDGAISKAQEGLTKDPSNDTLRDKKTKAETERKNRDKYEDFMKAAKGHDYDRAVTAYQEMSDDSVYRDKAEDTYAGVKRQSITEHLKAAREAQSGGKCEDARRHVEAVLLIDEGNQDAQEIAKKCGVTTPTPRPHVDKPHVDKPHVDKPHVDKPDKPDKPPVVAPPPVVTAPPSEDTEKTLNEAMDAYVNGRYVEATEKAKKANKGGSNAKAWRIIGASACYQKNRDEAIKAWNRLGQMDRQFVKYICNRNEITIP
jgi:pSer/pThr/pTyr-binding forkhead associated (FHA) protein/tetratricopeptide (TPR) repeat protein